MKSLMMFLWVAAIGMGCTTTSTVATRQQERSAAYNALTPEQRALVDQRQIKIGFPADAVYIAWGKPGEIVPGNAGDGIATTTWVYYNTTWEKRPYWTHRYNSWDQPRYGYVQPVPTLDYEPAPRNYIAAEVFFEKGVVKSWRGSPPPPP